jgi:hypothetical protein
MRPCIYSCIFDGSFVFCAISWYAGLGFLCIWLGRKPDRREQPYLSPQSTPNASGKGDENWINIQKKTFTNWVNTQVRHKTFFSTIFS